MNQPYRLKAPSRKDIEEQIPFELYVTDEDGNEQERFATADYSYHFIGHEWDIEPEYDEEGNVITEGTLSDYCLADLNVYDGTEIKFSDPVKVLDVNTPMHGWK